MGTRAGSESCGLCLGRDVVNEAGSERVCGESWVGKMENEAGSER